MQVEFNLYEIVICYVKSGSDEGVYNINNNKMNSLKC